MTETNILEKLYKKQLKFAGKSGAKTIFPSPISFDNNSVIKDKSVNYLDSGTADKLQLSLAAKEFDPTLLCNINFKDGKSFQVLITHLGVEELRAVLHYQLFHYQLLKIAVEKNQLLLDGSVLGIYELEFLAEKEDLAFVLPKSPNLNLSNVLAKNIEGYNLDTYNKEIVRCKKLFQEYGGDHVLLLSNLKTKARSMIAKKYQIFMNKLIVSNYKIEGKLRILRSYRIKLLHFYCRDVLREAYQDTLTIQLLDICNDLRLRYHLLPFKDRKKLLLYCGGSHFQENLPRKMQEEFLENDQIYNIDIYDDGKFQSLFYVPHSGEICLLDNRVSPDLREEVYFPSGSLEEINEVDLELMIRETVAKKPTMIKSKPYIKDKENGIDEAIVSNFKEAYHYSGGTYNLLVYMKLVLNIFDIQYSMIKLNSPSKEILNLEDTVLSGQIFWNDESKEKKKQEFTEDNFEEEVKEEPPEETTISMQLIKKIVQERREKKHLSEDLEELKQILLQLKMYFKDSDNKTVQNATQVLNKIHHLLYYQLIYGLDKKQNEFLHKDSKDVTITPNYLDCIKGNKNISIWTNGFFIDQALVKPENCDIDAHMYEDYQDFEMAHQPAIDEECLIPMQVRLVQKIHTIDWPNTKVGYPFLRWIFMNTNDIDRVSAYTTFKTVRKYVEEYSELSSISELGIDAQLDAQIQYLKKHIEANQLRNALMCWYSKQPLPKDKSTFFKLYENYKENIYWKVLHEKEKTIEIYKKDNEERIKNKTTSADLGGDIIELPPDRVEELRQIALVKSMNRDLKRSSDFMFVKSESLVVKREFEVLLIKSGIELISKYHAGLKGCLEMGVADNQVDSFIHPYQQFAATLFQTVDKNSHLDIVTKISFVQQFLTRLRNRWTEVETLTSGPGVVFSMKDFNDCIQTLCRGMIKYCETNLRSINETSVLKTHQLQHLVYVKERQMLYYQNKCKTFVNEIDKIINAKMAEKGANIIYELDITNRELRMLKDNYYLMERMMREEIKNQFIDMITNKDHQIKKGQEDLLHFRQRLSKGIGSEVYNEITTIEQRVIARANVYKRTDIKDPKIKLRSLEDAEKQRGIIVPKEKEIKFKDVEEQDQAEMSQHSEIEKRLDPYAFGHDDGSYEPYMPSVREELLQCYRALSNQKNFMRMKEIMMKEKHEREIFNLKQQLTSNECLWEQLAESEKREQIMRQELFFTQQSLATCEKIIEKMQTQLEMLQNQRLRLQQYKNNKSKRLDELESKVRQMEILENIDLNKLLDELRLRDRKLRQLSGVEKNLQSKIDSIYKLGEHKVQEMRMKYLQEKKIKDSAFTRLDTLRNEIRAIEGHDAVGDDIWKEKCKELFGLCKELQKENEELRSVSRIQEEHGLPLSDRDGALSTENMDSMAGGFGSNKVNFERTGGHSTLGGHNKLVKNDRLGSKTLTTKPSTAARKHRMIKEKQEYMSGGSLAGVLGIGQSEMSPRDSSKSTGI